MANVLDEDARYEILGSIAKNYPDSVGFADILPGEDRTKVRATLAYMEEKLLLDVSWAEDMEGKHPMEASATAIGYDEAAASGYFEDE